jgi:2-polyprenyl-3-methyl-5-hydroxy-6-metoxy-1,4-benzoquinol methylase
MNIKLNHCPLCNSGQFDLYKRCKDYTVSKETFSIVSCNNCGFKFTNPRPPEEALYKYYESDDYISHTNKGNNLLNNLYKLARVYTMQQKSQLLRKWSHKGSLLDIGCGTGDFLSYNKQLGWSVSGVEVSTKAREQAESQLQQTIYTDLQEVPEKKFHAITMWHVLEHVGELEQSCRQITELLDSKGTLVVAVPNCEAYDAEYYQEHWAAYDVPRHLYHFTPQTMERLWKGFGLHIKAVLPMKLDAYYVSMLSEKYKNGSTNMAKASWVGLQSNLRARKDNNYSSLIYIISK